MDKPNWNLGSKYIIGEKLGNGTYGSVYEAKNTLTGERLAIKSVKSLFKDEIETKQLLREILILRALNHSSIVKIKEILMPRVDFNRVFIAMEYAEGDLKKLSKSAVFLSPIQVRSLMYQAVCGIRYMHSANILHRDLKPANILINSDGSLKICDFGLSRSYRQPSLPSFKKNVKRVLTGHVVTRWYRAPEVILLEKEYGKEMDVWSLGCVFAELLGMVAENNNSHIERSPLFPGRSCFPLSPDLKTHQIRAGYPSSEHDQLNVILSVVGTPDSSDLEFITDPKAVEYLRSFPNMQTTSFREFLPATSDCEIDLLTQMLQFSPHKRINLDQALNHPYFHGVRVPELETLAERPADFVFDGEHQLDVHILREVFRKEVIARGN